MRVDFELRIISNNCDVLFDRLEMSLDNLTLLPVALNFLQYCRVFLSVYLIEAFYKLEFLTPHVWSNEN